MAKIPYLEPAGNGELEPPRVYNGAGTTFNPFIVEFYSGDLGSPMNFSPARKWSIILIVTVSVFAVTRTSSAYSGSANEVLAQFNCSTELFSLGISLYVLGSAIGPALWAPFSELYGRKVLFVTTHACMVAFVTASAGSGSMPALLVFRFLTGMFGASPLTNSGGVIASDCTTGTGDDFLLHRSVYGACPGSDYLHERWLEMDARRL